MIKEKLLVFFLSIGSLSSFANGYGMSDIDKLQNDKEVFITVFSDSQRDDVLEKYSDISTQNIITMTFKNSMLDFVNSSNLRCELNSISSFKRYLSENDLSYSEADIKEYLQLLRSTNEIDDILYELLLGISKDFHELQKMDGKKYVFTEKERKLWLKPREKAERKNARDLKRVAEANDISALYTNFKTWPDESNICLYKELNVIKTKMIDPKSEGNKIKFRRRVRVFEHLNRKALLDNVITPKTFMKLEYLRDKSFTKKRYLRLKDYLLVVFNAKNKMKSYSYNYVSADISKEFNFSSENVKRFSSLTRRKDLYEKYNETQIVLMAKVLQKASIRMGVDPDVESSRPVITQTFEVLGEDGVVRNYVEELELDPQSQFNLARRRMRKDLLDLEAMDIFNGATIFYDEVVMAAFETGYLTIEDIEYAIRYDDLWNPSESRFDRISGFIFSFAGYASFFVPPPYNVTASLGLAIIQGIVESKNIKGENNDNAATFIQ